MQPISANMPGTALPATPPNADLKDFAMKGATGYIPHWNDEGIDKLAFYPSDISTLRVCGGTENSTSSIPGFIFSLMWMRDKGIELPMEACINLRVFHRLNIENVKLIADRKDLTPISHREEHGILPVDDTFATKHLGKLVWVWLEDGKVRTSSPDITQWVNEGVKAIALHILSEVTRTRGDYDTMKVKQEAFDHNPFDSKPQPL